MPDERGIRVRGELAFGPFVLDLDHRQLRREGVPVRLTARPFDVLAFLIQNRGQTVSRDQLRASVWEGTLVSDAAVEQAVTKVRKALGDDTSNPAHVHTLWGKGYVFVGDVVAKSYSANLKIQVRESSQCLFADADPVHTVAPPSDSLDISLGRATSARSSHLGHISFVSVAYAALYAVGLAVETAFEFQLYGRGSTRLAMVAFLWIAGTIGMAMYVNLQRALHCKGGRNAAIGILTAGVVMMIAVIGPLLPSSTVTPFTYQGHTAQAAYLKNVIYFYALGVIFIILPYNVVVSSECETMRTSQGQMPTEFIFPRPALLFALLVGAGIWSLFSVARIFEHLLPGQYQNLYMIMLQIERVVGFGLAAECLVWYYLALARLDHTAHAV